MTVDRSKLGKANKRMGSNAEREYAKLFRELGFTFCRTSRQANRLLDDSGVDLTELPFNVQVKAGQQRGMNVSSVLSIIKERLIENFPPSNILHKLPSIVIHRKTVGRGKRRSEFDDIVSMSFEDFKKIINGNKEANFS